MGEKIQSYDYNEYPFDGLSCDYCAKKLPNPCRMGSSFAMFYYEGKMVPKDYWHSNDTFLSSVLVSCDREEFKKLPIEFIFDDRDNFCLDCIKKFPKGTLPYVFDNNLREWTNGTFVDNNFRRSDFKDLEHSEQIEKLKKHLIHIDRKKYDGDTY